MLAIVIVIIAGIITDEEWISINSMPIQLVIQLIRDQIWCQVSTLYPKYILCIVCTCIISYYSFSKCLLFEDRIIVYIFFPWKKCIPPNKEVYGTIGLSNPFADLNFQAGGYDIFISTGRWQKGEKYPRKGSYHCGLFKGLFVWYLAHSHEGLGVRVATRTTFRYLKVSAFIRICWVDPEDGDWEINWNSDIRRKSCIPLLSLAYSPSWHSLFFSPQAALFFSKACPSLLGFWKVPCPRFMPPATPTLVCNLRVLFISPHTTPHIITYPTTCLCFWV